MRKARAKPQISAIYYTRDKTSTNKCTIYYQSVQVIRNSLPFVAITTKCKFHEYLCSMCSFLCNFHIVQISRFHHVIIISAVGVFYHDWFGFSLVTSCVLYVHCRLMTRSLQCDFLTSQTSYISVGLPL